MAENRLTPTSVNNDEEIFSNKDSKRNNLNSSVQKSSDDNTKRHKSSFLANLRKKFSFPKKVKSIDKMSTKKDNTNTVSNEHDLIKSNSLTESRMENTISNESCKKENRLSVFRGSFGKGKNKENLSNKDSSNSDDAKNREFPCQNEVRPQSMHIANSHPPRNGLLASFGWYWGPLSRSEATHRLRHQDDGSFLVRDSEGDPNKFTLSFKGAGQIFHNRILQHQHKYAFLPDEEFNSIPDLIADAMRRSATSAYCFSRSTDAAPSNPNSNATDGHNSTDGPIPGTETCTVGSIHHKHEVRLLKPISRFADCPRSLKYLCRFMIRQYTRYQDLGKLIVNPEIVLYLEDPKYNL